MHAELGDNAAELVAHVHAHRMAQRRDVKGMVTWLRIASSMKALRRAAYESKRVLTSAETVR